MPASLLAALTLVAAVAAEPTGHLLTYRGQMAATQDDGRPPKQIEHQVLWIGPLDEPTALYWTVAELGRGGWSWPDRFGRYEPSPADVVALPDGGPAVLFDHGEGLGVAPLPSIYFPPPQPPELGAEWSHDRLDFEVVGERRLAGREAWEIQVRAPYGRHRVLHLDKTAPLVAALEATIFLGQGQQHRMRLALVDFRTLDAAELARATAAFDGWLSLRSRLELPQREPRRTWTPEQLEALRTALPPLVEAARETPLATVAQAAAEELQDQRGRAGAVAALEGMAVGKPAPAYELPALVGEPVSSAALRGKVVVLHFWEYRDAPLEEPYGQIGYLDYLHRRHKDKGVAVYGVSVDPRLADASTRPAGITSAKKLASFMNLSYPVLWDDGAVVKKFGDPRVAGAALPLYVVIGRQGEVLHYHAGLHEVDRQRGLVALERVVSKALQKGE